MEIGDEGGRNRRAQGEDGFVCFVANKAIAILYGDQEILDCFFRIAFDAVDVSYNREPGFAVHVVRGSAESAFDDASDVTISAGLVGRAEEVRLLLAGVLVRVALALRLGVQSGKWMSAFSKEPLHGGQKRRGQGTKVAKLLDCGVPRVWIFIVKCSLQQRNLRLLCAGKMRYDRKANFANPPVFVLQTFLDPWEGTLSKVPEQRGYLLFFVSASRFHSLQQEWSGSLSKRLQRSEGLGAGWSARGVQILNPPLDLLRDDLVLPPENHK